ncbi:hypothetical protein [Streptomyces natalensis]|uniref:hypothetical protein n=1 Tax=Streptomyces natalensis TaxID=68242 RepID=UPI000A4F5919|nr:hypothetical protein [Streptomyces natalensis]
MSDRVRTTSEPLPPPPRRRLVHLRRVPSALRLMCGADARTVRPYVLTGGEWDARRQELAEHVRRLNRWSSSGGGRV